MQAIDLVESFATKGIADTPFLQELVQQIRKRDIDGIYRDVTNETLLQFLLFSQQSHQLRLDGIAGGENEDSFDRQRIANFYHTVAARLERETGQIVQTFINLDREKPGWVLIFCGRLLVLSDILRNAQHFGFDSLEKLAIEGEKITQSALELARSYLDLPSNLQQS
jgi:probable nitrogen fixation protein